jgi:hypothetical protein
MRTASTRAAVVRCATKNGSSASASLSDAASTVHQIAWPLDRHEASAGACRSGLSWPRKAAKATPHSEASWTWWSTNVGTLPPCPRRSAPTSGQHPDLFAGSGRL